MNNSPFDKFVHKKNNAAIKEKFKQEKKQAKKKRAQEIEKHFQEKKAAREARFEEKNRPGVAPPQPSGAHPPKQDKEKKEIKKRDFSKKEIKPVPTPGVERPVESFEMPLNKYLAHCGIASRREAVALIAEEKVKVNGTTITEPAFKVSQKDTVLYNGKQVFITKNLVYILLNKPKDYITTTDDPQNRKTVLQLTQKATDQRIYPVGRLDRNTTGVLILTNDGELTQQLTHPSYNVKKVYQVTLDKPLTKADFEKILNGITLEDGEIYADALAYADARNKAVIGIELHSGKNRIVRRIFESMGYEVVLLDRVMYANLTKKNVERGRWRYLTEGEVRFLKYMNKKKTRQNNGKKL